MRSLTRIPLDRDGDACVRFDMPHDVDDVAGVLGAQLQADLATGLSGGERFKVKATATQEQVGKQTITVNYTPNSAVGNNLMRCTAMREQGGPEVLFLSEAPRQELV